MMGDMYESVKAIWERLGWEERVLTVVTLIGALFLIADFVVLVPVAEGQVALYELSEGECLLRIGPGSAYRSSATLKSGGWTVAVTKRTKDGWVYVRIPFGGGWIPREVLRTGGKRVPNDR